MKKHKDFSGREYIFEYPPYSPQDLRRREGSLLAARLMINAALTAPFVGGVSHVEAELVYGQREQEEIARKMEELSYTKRAWEKIFKYEAVMAREADGIIFLGSRMASDNATDASCGLCGGKPDCSYFYEQKKTKYGLVDNTNRQYETVINGPLCSIRVNDLGFAVGSALWIATRLLVDARPFASMGIAGKLLGYCQASDFVIGIPVATLAKNPFVDINPDYHLINMAKIMENAKKQFITPRTVSTFEYRKWIPKEEEGKKDGED